MLNLRLFVELYYILKLYNIYLKFWYANLHYFIKCPYIAFR